MANKILNCILCISFIAFGLGGGIDEGGKTGDGFIIIEFYKNRPDVKPMTISTHGIHLFTFEL
jgi:hypothetical protein